MSERASWGGRRTWGQGGVEGKQLMVVVLVKGWSDHLCSEVLRPWRAGLFSGDSEAPRLFASLNFEAIADSYITHVYISLSID